jgi:hypothetical protein
VAPLDLIAGEASEGVGTEQIIVALIGALALILVALVPVLITSARRGAATTTPSAPAANGSTISPQEAQQLWNAIEGIRRDQGDAALRAAREHGALDERVAETRRDLEGLGGEHRRLSERVQRHIGSPGHQPGGPATDA